MTSMVLCGYKLLQKLKALVMLDSRALTVAWRANLLRTTTVDDEDAQYFPRIRAPAHSCDL